MADQLSINAAEAKTAGLSYGKYMAMMQGAVQTAPPEPEGNRVCIICGKKFFAKGNRICCSQTCSAERDLDRALFYMRERRERLKEEEANEGERKCVVCGNIYLPIKSNQKTCCHECSEELNRIRQRERNRRDAEERSKK